MVIALTEQHICPLKRLQLPKDRFKWHKIGAPAHPRYIHLGEADAAVWCAEDRLRRPADDGCRFVHPLDSATCVGAFSKGRSASHLLNSRCKRLCAIGISGGHEVFYPWIPSGDNPADEPSRRFEAGDGIGSMDTQPCIQQQQPLAAETVVVDPFTLKEWAGGERIFVHLCSGTERDDDVVSWVEALSSESGHHVVGMRVDPLCRSAADGSANNMSPHDNIVHDLLDGAHSLALMKLIHTRRVIGIFASPPRSTFSAARHRILGPGRRGPRPLRARQTAWYP